jgi:hypothetical protein
MYRKIEPAAVTRTVFTALLLCYAASALADPSQKLFEGDYFIHGLSLASDEVMPELKRHYRTLGTPTHDETGLITNAVLLLHGAGQDGETFLSEGFAGAMFGPGQPLDALHYFLILPDSGCGQSTCRCPGGCPGESRGGHRRKRAESRLACDTAELRHCMCVVPRKAQSILVTDTH